MERPIFKPIGTPVEMLDTPSLIVDLDLLERNIETMHSFFRSKDARLRPHVGSHLCPAIAHKQLAAGGTVGGVCVTTVGQAEVFAESGFDDIFVSSMVVTPQKIMRLCGLARHAAITVAVDNPSNVSDLSEAASESGAGLDVVLDINTRLDRCGVEPGEPAVGLARAVHAAAGLRFAGLMTYEGRILEEDADKLAAESRKWIQRVLDTREMIESAGIEVGLVSVGGTYNYEVAAAMTGVTEVPAGSYALLDDTYRPFRTQFEPAARVMTTVSSLPEPGIVITDGGLKSIGSEWGDPSVYNVAGARVRGLSAEHANLQLDGDSDRGPGLDEKVWLTPADIGTCVNLHDYMFGVRGGRLELVWDIPARGRYR